MVQDSTIENAILDLVFSSWEKMVQNLTGGHVVNKTMIRMCCPVRLPFLKKDIDLMEKVDHRAYKSSNNTRPYAKILIIFAYVSNVQNRLFFKTEHS